MNYIYTLAQAAQTAQDQPTNSMSPMITVILVVVMFYFIAIRPTTKRQKELKARQDALKVGDKVITGGGIYGIVREVQDEAVKMEVAPNVIIKILKSQIVHTVGRDGSPEN